ncbi:hypothetical protein CEXT_4431 [Caerostris extrusa]|uniref:Uncharacterized protein n=1 Tax=Caerostris extrusa TaxID=172846 RepID=A0AAV4N0X0_CAEEX|nr:hypothetical protein CEXT_4431 [Caerostris extrusa]
MICYDRMILLHKIIVYWLIQIGKSPHPFSHTVAHLYAISQLRTWSTRNIPKIDLSLPFSKLMFFVRLTASIMTRRHSLVGGREKCTRAFRLGHHSRSFILTT